MKIIVALIVVALIVFFIQRMMGSGANTEEVLKIGRDFLTKNALEQGVITTASGLQYQVLKTGTGDIHPKASDRVTVHYHGTLIDGTVFDSSVDRGEPIAFGLTQIGPRTGDTPDYPTPLGTARRVVPLHVGPNIGPRIGRLIVSATRAIHVVTTGYTLGRLHTRG